MITKTEWIDVTKGMTDDERWNWEENHIQQQIAFGIAAPDTARIAAEQARVDAESKLAVSIAAIEKAKLALETGDEQQKIDALGEIAWAELDEKGRKIAEAEKRKEAAEAEIAELKKTGN